MFKEQNFLDEKEYSEKFMQNVKQVLKERHMTQCELADAIGVSTVTMSNYMKGKSTPSSYIALKMAKALKCDLSKLVDIY